MPNVPRLAVGSLVFDDLDQIDLTGPFEVLSRLPGATHKLYARTLHPVRDTRGLRILPDAMLAEAPRLDILHVPGGPGQQALMHDEAVLGWLRAQAEGARSVLSVCTGALLLGAAGLLRGRRATTHWNSFHLLPLFGAVPVDERVVIDGNWVFTAGVTHGLDGQLKSELLGQEARRFEDNGSMEVDQPRMRWFSPQGVLTTAQADLARTNADRDDYLLRGHAVVVRNAAQLPDGQRLERLEFQGEHLRILTKEERVVSDQPVLLVRGRNRITAGSLDWSERDRVANLRGRVQAVLPGRQPP